MRLDKFLKVSRLVKRRTLANELCVGGGVQVNEKVAKPATEVHPGDVLTLIFGNRTLTVKVELVPEKAVPAQSAASLYTVLADHYNRANMTDLTEL
jgi:ribosomal 50S subunit-recycling heat shock protein